MVRQGMYEVMSIMYSNPADVLSQLIRTAFVAENGKRFIVADFSAIEARVIAWLADENGEWRLSQRGAISIAPLLVRCSMFL